MSDEWYPKQGLVFPCGRTKRLVCWIWHRNGHWTVEEIADAKQRAAELRERLGWYDTPTVCEDVRRADP